MIMKDNIQCLLALYRESHREMIRHRDMEWKIISYTTALLIGISTITRLRSFPVQHLPYLRTLLIVFTISSTFYGIWHLYFVHKQLTFERNIRRHLERHFGFYKDIIKDNKTILPQKWQNEEVRYSQGISHIILWWFFIILLGSYTIYSICLM